METSTATFVRRSNRIYVIGDLDMASGPQLDAALTAFDGQEVALDLSQLEFIDSSGIHALARARRVHPALRIEGVSERARRVFDLIGVTALLLPETTSTAN